MAKICSNCGKTLATESDELCFDCAMQLKHKYSFKNLWLPDIVTFLFLSLSGISLLFIQDEDESALKLFLFCMCPFYLVVLFWNFISNIIAHRRHKEKKSLLQCLDERYKRQNGHTSQKWWTRMVLLMGVLFCIIVIIFAFDNGNNYFIFSIFSVLTYVSYMFGEYNLFAKRKSIK